MIDLPQPTGAELWPPEEPGPRARLHKPWRTLVAVVEVLLAVAAGWAAYACWHSSVATVVTRTDDGAVLESHRYFGGLLAAAIGLGTVTALLLVDAVRQLSLAIRARGPKPRG
ncbi:hypothetical protein [Amycolatopsis vancoresmycina]|uniref:Uncharacterized protein n=1 Tax=Amycolatopsis vancoresmycina DSM 44592 TaxID=1292037 RepID=R1G7Z6_9PSEU|nr:hypothetical protein [Amycolatopsis vancoresmycina]EOD67513.1 hypothetical protein H480_16276 [Amycolatopsis vancoresmycina DSM 44592]